MYKCSYTCTLTNRWLLCKICCHLPKFLSRCEVVAALDLLADDTMLEEFVVRWESCCKPRYRISRELCIKSRHQAIYARVRYISHPFNSIPDDTSTCSNYKNVPGWPDSVGNEICHLGSRRPITQTLRNSKGSYYQCYIILTVKSFQNHQITTITMIWNHKA